MNRTIKLMSTVGKAHREDLLDKETMHQIKKGGRASLKTSANMISCTFFMIHDNNHNVVVLRRHKNAVRQSVYAEAKIAFRRLGLIEGIDYKAYLSPMKIVYLKNGNTMYFGGLDNYEALKGMVADPKPTDYLDDEEISETAIKTLYMSEITEFKSEEDMRQAVATFSRGDKDSFRVLYDFNPPKNKYNWVNVWVEKMAKRSDVKINHSSYLQAPIKWVGKSFVKEANEIKKNDPKAYAHIYLGEVTGLDGLIHNSDNIQIVDCVEDALGKDDYIINYDISVDSGHQTSATVYLAVAHTKNKKIILLDTYYYSPNGRDIKKAPSEFSEDLYRFYEYVKLNKYNNQSIQLAKMIIDSAEGGLRNQVVKDYPGLPRFIPVAKKLKTDMIDNVDIVLAKKQLYVVNNPNNRIFIIEHQKYQWKEGTVESGKPEPDKAEVELLERYFNTHSQSEAKYHAEHTCDAFQYELIENERKVGIRR